MPKRRSPDPYYREPRVGWKGFALTHLGVATWMAVVFGIAYWCGMH